MKLRVHIIGGPGSGKSYAAARLAARFGVLAYDLDDLFWDRTALNYAIRAETKERDRRLAAIVSQDGWIIEGVYYQWLAPSFEAADMILALTPSVWIRHWYVIRRFMLRKFGSIPSKHESLIDLWRLLRWSHAYDANHLVQARRFIARQGCQLIDCRTGDEVLVGVRELVRG